MNKFTVVKAKIEILEKIANLLEECKSDATHDYKVVGKEEEQATSWKTGELLWEDEEKTIPRFRDRWENVELTEEEMTDERKATLEAVKELEKALDKLM